MQPSATGIAAQGVAEGTGDAGSRNARVHEHVLTQKHGQSTGHAQLADGSKKLSDSSSQKRSLRGSTNLKVPQSSAGGTRSAPVSPNRPGTRIADAETRPSSHGRSRQPKKAFDHASAEQSSHSMQAADDNYEKQVFLLREDRRILYQRVKEVEEELAQASEQIRAARVDYKTVTAEKLKAEKGMRQVQAELLQVGMNVLPNVRVNAVPNVPCRSRRSTNC